jgi:Lrp/AsnC family transcriptional regulator for asnA, asnC and gidA
MKENNEIDSIDKKILIQLQDNSRISLTELSNKFKMTRNAIKYRINKLEEDGYIRNYTAIINPSKFGKKVTALFNFNPPLNEVKRFANKLTMYENITNVYFTTGGYSICAIGIFDNHDELNRFLIDHLSKMPIRDYIVSTILERYKEQVFELK